MEHPWVGVGDFSAIHNDSECIGGNPRPLASMAEFSLACIEKSLNRPHLATGLKRTKLALRDWNKNIFG